MERPIKKNKTVEKKKKKHLNRKARKKILAMLFQFTGRRQNFF